MPVSSLLLFFYRRLSPCDTGWLAEFLIPGCFFIWDIITAGEEETSSNKQVKHKNSSREQGGGVIGKPVYYAAAALLSF